MDTLLERELGQPATDQALAELSRIVASPEFRNAERLTRLLRYVVEHTLDGSTHRLKEVVLGGEVFDRRDFDPRVDPIVRVEASRLRKRLDDFYRRSGCPNTGGTCTSGTTRCASRLASRARSIAWC